jgi:hypothetical protein
VANPELQPNALAKPARGTRKRVKARRQRQAAKVAKSVREDCVERDGFCLIWRRATSSDWARLANPICDGPSEWAHIGQHRRCHTQGQAPEQRHTTKGSGMLCQRHHVAYDAHAFDIEPLTDAGMNGAFKVVVR